MKLQVLAFALAIALAACSPQSAPEATAPPEVENSDQQAAALSAALTPVATTEIGQPLALQVQTSRVMNEWAWVIAQPTQPDGAAIDWSTTAMASRYENGVLGDNGMIYALLRQDAGVWTVVEYTIGPTDVAWLDWPARHGAPEDIFEMPQDPPAP
jgi:hypothetical protein